MGSDFDQWWQRLVAMAKKMVSKRPPVDLIVLDEFQRYRTHDPYLSLYDPASGTGGFLLHALHEAQAEHQRKLSPEEQLKIREAQRTSAARMALSARKTALASLCERIVRRWKLKPLEMSVSELEDYAFELLQMQQGRCKITGLQMHLDGASTDPELLCSLDRKDSAKGYVRGNLQIVCRFINQWKSNSDDSEFRRLISLLRIPEHAPAYRSDDRRYHRL